MRVYRTCWLGVWVPCGLLGAGLAAAWAWAASGFLFVVFAVAGGVLMFCRRDYWQRSTVGRLKLLAAAALTAGLAVCAFSGYATVLGPGALLLALAAVVSSPYAVLHGRRWLRRFHTPSEDQLEALARAFACASPTYPFLPPPREPRCGLCDLTDEQLCKRWRASFRASQRATTPAKLVAAAAERRMYLDELERRNPAGFRAWLAGDPQASDPLPYLAGGHRGTPPTVDWDELTRGQG